MLPASPIVAPVVLSAGRWPSPGGITPGCASGAPMWRTPRRLTLRNTGERTGWRGAQTKVHPEQDARSSRSQSATVNRPARRGDPATPPGERSEPGTALREKEHCAALRKGVNGALSPDARRWVSV